MKQLLIAICCVGISMLNAQDLSHLQPNHRITSEITNEEMQLFVSLPNGYADKTDKKFPVLYFLDGRRVFESFRSAQHLLQIKNEIEDVILVGIGYDIDQQWMARRFSLSTPSAVTGFHTQIEKNFGLPEGSVSTGQAANFLKSLKEEVIAFVEKNYRTNGSRGLVGHSLSGLFTSYVMLNNDATFQKFSIGSPALWWDNQKLLKDASKKMMMPNIESIEKVLAVVGGAEQKETLEESKQLFNLIETNFKQRTEDYQIMIFEEESHFSVIPAFVSKTLSYLYNSKDAATATAAVED